VHGDAGQGGGLETSRRIAITEVSGFVGQALVERLAKCEEVESIVGVDLKLLGPHTKLDHYRMCQELAGRMEVTSLRLSTVIGPHIDNYATFPPKFLSSRTERPRSPCGAGGPPREPTVPSNHHDPQSLYFASNF
jgi:nucleoside-diphosphate-sugar epimerase